MSQARLVVHILQILGGFLVLMFFPADCIEGISAGGTTKAGLQARLSPRAVELESEPERGSGFIPA